MNGMITFVTATIIAAVAIFVRRRRSVWQSQLHGCAKDNRGGNRRIGLRT